MAIYRKKVITRSSNEPYLIRYTLIKNKWFSIKIHKILLSDDACWHDHPWSFISFILKGGYKEYSDKNPNGKFFKPLSVLWRPAEWKHRLEITQPCWTLIISFKRKRKWGFFTKEGWVEWFNYNQGSNQCDE